jgi:hypothetical protein
VSRRLPVAAVLALLALPLAGCGGSDEGARLPLGRQIAARATFTPTVHVFAEPVAAELEVIVDREHLDPDRVRPDVRFLPYDVDHTSSTREDHGRFAVLRYAWTLRCLRIACIPEILPSDAGEAESGRGERRTFRVRAAQVRYEEASDGSRVLTRAAWPELVSVSRLKQSDVPQYGFVFKVNVTPLPEPDYRVSPTLLGAGLLAGAAALLALPAGLAIGWLRRRRPPPPAEEEREPLTPLERALQLVEWASSLENGSERREALEVLAVELEEVERPDLARSARTLAWSPPAPSADAAERLVADVREADGR